MRVCLLLTGAVAAVAALAFTGCSSSRESAGADTMTQHVGVYTPPPAGAWRPRVGVPQFKVTSSEVTGDAGAVAADQLTTLAIMSNRFDVIERAQLEQLLAEQNMSGVVKDGEVTKAAQIRGVNYLIIGKITNFRVKAEDTKGGFNLGSIGGYFGAFDMQNSKSVITVECGVDLRLVDPESGSTGAAHFAEYKRTDSLSSMGVGVLGYSNKSEATLKLDEDNQGKVLRLALDDALRKMLPQVDAYLASKKPATP